MTQLLQARMRCSLGTAATFIFAVPHNTTTMPLAAHNEQLHEQKHLLFALIGINDFHCLRGVTWHL